ncbi:MAG: hypothetical protein PF487_00445, partial [Bacteroidales bacterium]|nr:hypothetical protein [Bacteroidales bacterium]
DEKRLKLIYILKIGYNAKDEGLYEFIFSLDHENIDVEGWCWDLNPACDNAIPPSEEYIDAIFNLKTNSFDLFCLHEAVEREYMHGYHTIHALAYEVEKEDDDGAPFSDYESMFENNKDELPLLVFHYGMTLEKIKNLLVSRKIILKNDEFVETSSIKL